MRFPHFQLLNILAWSAIGLLALGAPSTHADDVAEVAILWKPGDMVANPAANLVYVVNETASDVIAINSATGSVVAHKRFQYSLNSARLFFPADASALYVSVPHVRKLYRLDPSTLAETSAVDLDIAADHFVIAADGFLYCCDASEGGSQHLLKVDPASGSEVARVSDPLFYTGSLFRLNNAGDGFYVLQRGIYSGSGTLSEFATSTGAPVFQADHFDEGGNNHDLFVDDANDRLYRSSGGAYGVEAWNITSRTQMFWSFGGPKYGKAVTLLPGSITLWGASGDDLDGVLVEFNKQTGNLARTITIGSENSDWNRGELMSGSLEISGNGRLMYTKEDWRGNSVDGSDFFIGLTDITALDVNYTPASQTPFAPHGITASDEKTAGLVDIEWAKSTRATGYDVYRNTSDDTATATLIGSVVAPVTEYGDTTGVIGQEYHYWVRATNSSGSSPFGLSDEGSVLLPPGQISNFSAGDGLSSDKVYVSRRSDPDASGFRIYRSTTDDFATATEIGSSEDTSFYDTTALPGQQYYYWGRLENAAGLGEVGASNAGHAGDFDPPQSAPAFVSADDGTSQLEIDIRWGSVSDARHYEVFRHTTADFGAASLIATTNFALTLSVADTSAEELVAYHYWVRGANTAGSGPLSASDTGYRAELTAPAAPTSVSATDGNYIDRIDVTWWEPEYADHYTIYRSTSNDVTTASAILTTESRGYSDYSAIPGITYYYWLTASNVVGTSPFSSVDSGFATRPPPPPGPPQFFNATDGRYKDRVQVSWSSVDYARTYKVFRSDTTNLSSATLIATTTEQKFDDTAVIPLQTYYYWVKAVNVAGETDYSDVDPGFSKVDEPRNIYASGDLFDEMVRVTWTSVAEAAYYRIYRSPSGISSLGTQIARINAPAHRYEDHTAVAGEYYNYRVQAELAGGQLSLHDINSEWDRGHRAVISPQGTGFIAVDDPRDVEFDISRGKVYITTQKGIVEIYDLAQQDVLNAEWNTDGNLSGADLGPNNETLLLAQTRLVEGSNLGWVDKIDLTDSSLQSFGYVRDDLEDGAYDVTLLNATQALVTTSGNGWNPFRMLDLSDGTFIAIDTTGSGIGAAVGLEGNSLLSRTPDRSKVLVQEAGNSGGEFSIYDPASGAFGPTSSTGDFQYRGALSPDGSMAAMPKNGEIQIRSTTDGSILRTLNNAGVGIAFDPGRPYLFALDEDTDAVRVFSTSDWSEIDMIDLNRPIRDYHSKYKEGHLVIDPTSNWLAVTFKEGVMLLDISSYLFPLPEASTSLTATDHSTAEGISITWSSVIGAASYELWRSVTDDFGTADQIATNLVPTEYLDDSIEAGTVYYYWARGTNNAGTGPASPSDDGERRINPPSNLTASDGDNSHLDRISLSWNPSISASNYSVFRSLSNDPATATQIASAIASTSYHDSSATRGTVYHYWVVAHGSSGPSEVSISDSGFIALGAPNFVNATSGLFEDIVRITWHSSADATHYRIYRNTGDASPSATEIGTVAATELRFEDQTAIPGQDYFYWVEAEVENQLTSPLSLSDSGFRADEPTAGEAYLPIENPRDVIFDTGRNRAYITTQHGIIEVYDIQTKKVLNEAWHTDSTLVGADISSDGQTLIFAQAKSSLAPGIGQVGTIDLTTGQMAGHQYPLEADELSPYDIVAVTGDQVIFTSDGTTTSSPLRKLNLTTGVISPLADGSGGVKSVTARSLLSKTGDRTKVLVHNRTPSNAPFFLFDPASGQFGFETQLPLGYKFGTISPDGTLIASTQTPDIDIRNADDGSHVHTVTGRASGVAFDPTRPIFYAAHKGLTSVYAYSTSDWTEQAIIFDTHFLLSREEFDSGDLTVNSDGTLLAVQMSDGVLMVQPNQYFDTPGSPQNVTATQFTDTSGISVNWQAGADATSYTIFRSETNDPSTAAQVAIRPEVVTYVDTNAQPDTIYYYWVKSTNHHSESAFSLVASGGRKLSPPSNFTASDDAFTNRVELNWTTSPSALSYTILRSETDNISSAVELTAGVTDTAYGDTNATPGTLYFYWIKALGSNSTSDYSASDSGSRQLAGPEGVALDTSSSSAVQISWESVSNANLYRVYRSHGSNPAGASLIGVTDQLVFTDTTASHGQTYFWFVQAATAAYTSGLSAPATGHRIFPAPQNLNATSNLRDRVYLTWSAVNSPADRYELRRAISNDFSASSAVTVSFNTGYFDTTAPSGLPLYYWVRAMTSTASGEWSQAFQGYRRIDNFDEFAADHGLTGDDALATADPDDDEFSNFEEWAQGGSDPTDSSSRPPLIPRFQTVSDADYLTVSYLRFYGGNENGASYEHEWATYASRGTLDLESGQWPNTPLSATPPSELDAAPSGYEWGCVRLPVSTDNSALGFLQLKVTSPSP